MEKYQLFNILLGTYVIGGSIYFLKYKEKTLKIIQDLKKENISLKSNISKTLHHQKEHFKNDIQKHIQNEKKLFVDNMKTSIDNFANNKTFEFVIDENLHKSEFINLKDIISEKKDKYAYYFSMLMHKESKENKELKELVEDFKRLNEDYKSSLEKVNLKIKSINEVIDINSNNSKEGKKLAKNFEERITTLEDLTFNSVLDDSGSDEYSFIGSLDDENSSGGFSGAEMNDIKSNLQLPPKPKKDNSIANRYKNM